jgi:hypothetical protein
MGNAKKAASGALCAAAAADTIVICLRSYTDRRARRFIARGRRPGGVGRRDRGRPAARRL